MPHRGRLNVLANIVGKSYAQIFREFEGNIDPRTAHGSGDVKYHLGAEGDVHRARRRRRSRSACRPTRRTSRPSTRCSRASCARSRTSSTRARTASPSCRCCCTATRPSPARASSPRRCRWASCAATAPAAPSTSSSTTRSASRPARTSARSSVYATDVARMVQAPIFHVNGDDPEACVRVAKLAFDYRQAFKKDVVIDMVCYRRRGHSEVDEPSFTQPLMYDTIDNKRSVRKIYTENLIGRGDITVEEAEEALRDYQEQLEKVFQGTRDAVDAAPSAEPAMASRADGRPAHRDPDARSSRPIVDTPGQPARGLHRPPAPAAAAAEARARWSTTATIDWALGETLAFGSLLLEGRPVRLAGQDSRRGTFGHRHAVARRPGRPATSTRRWRTCPTTRRRSTSTTRCCQRVRRDGLRVRLLRRPARRARAVGGAVRRLRQRRDDDRRRVHRRRRGEVGPALRRDAAAAARLRGPGAGPLVRPRSSASCSCAPRTT